MNNNQLANATIMRQNPLTGFFTPIQGVFNEADIFYNGRAFNLNSADWININPRAEWVSSIHLKSTNGGVYYDNKR